MKYSRVSLILFHLALLPTITFAAAPATQHVSGQRICLPEIDATSPRKSKLKSEKPDSNEIIRLDLDNDGDPDILETWWNGKRCRWVDENDDMKWSDARG